MAEKEGKEVPAVGPEAKVPVKALPKAKVPEIVKPGPLVRIKQRELVKALVTHKGKVREAAQELQITERRALKLINAPNFQVMLTQELERRGLGVERYITELDRGLKEGKLGKHSDYLAAHERLLGISGRGSGGADGNVQVNLLFAEMKKRGLDNGDNQDQPEHSNGT